MNELEVVDLQIMSTYSFRFIGRCADDRLHFITAKSELRLPK